MSTESTIHDEDGNPTHIRVTSDDGRSSTLHEYDDILFSPLWHHRGEQKNDDGGSGK